MRARSDFAREQTTSDKARSGESPPAKDRSRRAEYPARDDGETESARPRQDHFSVGENRLASLAGLRSAQGVKDQVGITANDFAPRHEDDARIGGAVEMLLQRRRLKPMIGFASSSLFSFQKR